MSDVDLARALSWKEAHPCRALPAAACRIFLDALDAGRQPLASCAALGTAAGTERVRRGDDGVAYLGVRYGDSGEFAYLALTPAEADALGVQSLADQNATKAAAIDRRAKSAAQDARFLRDLDL